MLQQKSIDSSIDFDEEKKSLFELLKELCSNNLKHFQKDDSSNGVRIHGAFQSLIDHIEVATNKVADINSFAHEYDFDETTPGNGYRSFVVVVDSCLRHSIKIARHGIDNRSSILFRKGIYMKEVEACSHLLASLCVCLDHLMTLRSWSVSGNLFTEQGHTAEELLSHGGAINQYCFYGRCLGFQFCKSMRSVLKFISSCMAGFSEGFYSDRGKIGKTTSSMWTSGKFLFDPELRARRIVNLSQNSDVHFCKAFWFLAESETMAKVPSIVGTAIKINKVIKIPPEPLFVPHQTTGELVEIPVPTAHIGPGPVIARLLCYTNRKGMMGDGGQLKSGSSIPPAKGLILHCHGGGFVAQSSKSHEIYLREWAVALDVPILSIDYSLAPEAPFPRALEEVFYAYCWALNNCEFLGTTAENIILAGDSAGANLNLACTLKCIEMGVRKPDGVLLLYCPVLINFVVSPARLLCLMDPLLPFSFMMSCLKAYTCPSDEILEENRKRVAQLIKIKSKTHQLFSSSTASTATDSRVKTVVEKDAVKEKEDEDEAKAEEPKTLVVNENELISSDNSNSLEMSTWEAIPEADFKSPQSDLSDTMASASFDSMNTRSNTEVPTPDGSNGISFEEDSQPIQKHFSIINGKDALYEFSSDMNLDDELLPDDPTSQYVSDFLDRYVLDSDLERQCPTKEFLKSRTQSEENIVFDVTKEAVSIASLQNGIQRLANNLSDRIKSPLSQLVSSRADTSSSTELKNAKIRAEILDSMEARSPSEEFKFEVPKNPFVSPYYASDDTIKQLPPIKIITLELDPCLDDCVMFAKKLKSLDKSVGLDILSGLPHGFLNFVSVSKDAMEGSKLCIQRMAELLGKEVPGEKTKPSC